MIHTNDLIGLEYGWGHRPGDGSGKTDCFQLACELHRRLGHADYASEFAWVYERYTDSTFNRVHIARWLLQNASRQSAPEIGTVVLLPSDLGAALGTYVDTESAVFIGPALNVIRTALPVDAGQLFWMNR